MDDLITPRELHERLASDDPPTVIDVRDADLYRAGHIPGVMHIPREKLAANLNRIRKDKPVVTY